MSCRGAGRAGVNWTCTSEFKKETENMFSPVKKNPVGLFKEKKKEYIVQFTFKIFLLAIEFYLYPFFL